MPFRKRHHGSSPPGAAITRRDFLGSTLLASGSALLGPLSPRELLAARGDDWTGYGGVGDYATANGNTWEVMLAGHKMRDGQVDPLRAVDTGEIFDCVAVGGGISGLAAAVFFTRQAGAGKTCLVLDNHSIFGGEARQNEFEIDGRRVVSHQGSAIYFVQYPRSFLAEFYDSIGLRTPRLEYQKWSGRGPEPAIGRSPYDSAGLATGQYGFWFGRRFGQRPGVWSIDPLGRKLAGAPIRDEARAELLRFFSGASATGVPFARPVYEGDEISRRLDGMTLEDHIMERTGISRETVRAFLSPVEGGGSGLGADALSAYTDYAADMLHPFDGRGEALQMFPGGNTTIARLLVKTLVPRAIPGEATVEAVTRNSVDFAALDAPGSPVRIRLGHTVVSVAHGGPAGKSEFVTILTAKGDRLYRIRARSVVMAGGSWSAKHIVKDLPAAQKAAYEQFYRSPCLMASVALRNWRFLEKMGITGCRWFEGVGNSFEVRRLALTGDTRPTLDQDSPVVVTLKHIYSYPGLSTEEQGHRGRGEMLATSFRDYERRIREQFTDMFGSAGFDASRDIAGIILNRWGHAYLSPQPGFFFGTAGRPAPRETLRSTPHGRVAFANTDLAGAMDHRFSILEARRAVAQLFDQVLTE